MSLIAAFVLTVAAATSPLPAWNFSSDAQGWNANDQLKNVGVQKGCLCADAVDRDPMLVRGDMEFSATAAQYVEIQLTASRPGKGELFWTGSTEGPYGGFSQEKSTTFSVSGNGRRETLRIYPFWQGEQVIRKLRLDLYDKTHFEIASIAVKSREGKVLTSLENPLRDMEASPDGRSFWSPPLDVVPDALGYAVVTMRTNATTAELVWAVADKSGVQSVHFDTEPNNETITYNVELAGQPGWGHRVVALGIKTTEPGATIESIALSNAPQGEARLVLDYFGPENAGDRAGTPRTIWARFVNRGGKDSAPLSLALKAGADIQIDKAAAVQTLPAIKPGLKDLVQWNVICPQPGSHTATLPLPNGKQYTSVISASEAVPVTTADYVPVPHPVQTAVDVCAYYFPGWETNAKWECIRNIAPIRKPALGYYDESNPECVDWQIKWAVENGISCFLVDWYWAAGNQSLTHWFDAYRTARYRDMLKVAIMWANHNGPGTHSQEDWTAVTKEWIDRYFNLPAYYRVDEKPVVMIWAPENVRRDLNGATGVKQALNTSQNMAKQAGYPGICFVAMGDHFTAPAVKTLLEEGYSAISTYHEWGDAAQAAMETTNRMPYARLVESFPNAWKEKDTLAGALDYWPVVDSGWDTRPWHGDKVFRIEGRTTDLFEQLLKKGRDYVQENKKKQIVLGPLNEWGEGSYLEPCTEYGFGMYEAVRRTFATTPASEYPKNRYPAEVKRGPYDYPPIEAVSEWTAAKGNLSGRGVGWKPFMNVARFRVENGKLFFTTGSDDAALFAATKGIDTAIYHSVTITMTLSGALPPDAQGQLFWGSDRDVMSGETCVSFPLQTDGLEHTYTLPLQNHGRWRGTVTTLRLDPCATRGVSVMVSGILFSK